MELLSPAGNVEKLSYAYAYGADAAYIGLKKFSLRVKADNFYEDEYKKVIQLKNQFPGKRLHCALNIIFHDEEIDSLKQNLDYFKQYPIDAFIVQDIGIVPLLQKEFPNTELHLSTQASCVNSQAVKMYKDMGFSRIVLGREISLNQIKRIKDFVPDMQLEAFVHGAMCIAYAGRCLMSAYLTGRSAQSGFCSHSCRWEYSVYLEEHQRRGELFPVIAEDDFTAILSSKDLRMIDYLKEMKDSGIDSLKIEGRMKSVYYVAMVTRAYRKALDVLEGKISSKDAKPFIEELENVSHRESTTGFYFNKEDANKTTTGASDSKYYLAAQMGKEILGKEFEILQKNGKALYDDFITKLNAMHPQAKEARLKDLEIHTDRKIQAFEVKDGWHLYECVALNKIYADTQIEFVSPDTNNIVAKEGEWELINAENGTKLNWVCDSHPCVIYTKYELSPYTLLRVLDPEYHEGIIRDSGR